MKDLGLNFCILRGLGFSVRIFGIGLRDSKLQNQKALEPRLQKPFGQAV